MGMIQIHGMEEKLTAWIAERDWLEIYHEKDEQGDKIRYLTPQGNIVWVDILPDGSIVVMA
ncbi:hypothetical protein LCGC14_0808130 [marine sediment metagenome]|uniref:Uncharacterized protein n=1 Tax=marine sediment metagenome TaxID=412755 RepID=A0A0F9Q7N1_9ZZZZ